MMLLDIYEFCVHRKLSLSFSILILMQIKLNSVAQTTADSAAFSKILAKHVNRLAAEIVDSNSKYLQSAVDDYLSSCQTARTDD